VCSTAPVGAFHFLCCFLSRIPHVPSKCRGLYLKSMARFMQKNCGHETTFFLEGA
jgi:hypothetical protein